MENYAETKFEEEVIVLCPSSLSSSLVSVPGELKVQGLGKIRREKRS